MRVALSTSFAPIKAPGSAVAGRNLLAPEGASVVLGWQPDALVAPVVAGATSLFGPRGVCLHPNGSLWVCDTGHHRLLAWRSVPVPDNAPADMVFGQPDFGREGRNARGAVGRATLNVPTGICAWRGGLAVADAWNHRVLLWHAPPHDGGLPDVVLGQADFVSGEANRGADRPSAATLHWPYGVAAIGDALAVADTGNRRVLFWNDPSRNGQPADAVLGQADFVTRDENAGRDVSARGMRWPHGIALWQGHRGQGHLAVADAGNNRIMLWDGLPTRSGQVCDAVLGQARFDRCDHNRASYYPSADTLNMPYAVAVAGAALLVADTANSRLLGFAETSAGAAAVWLAGQPDFASKGDNGWGVATRTSLCWPYGLAVAGSLLAVADSGNNRVLLWHLAADVGA